MFMCLRLMAGYRSVLLWMKCSLSKNELSSIQLISMFLEEADRVDVGKPASLKKLSKVCSLVMERSLFLFTVQCSLLSKSYHTWVLNSIQSGHKKSYILFALTCSYNRYRLIAYKITKEAYIVTNNMALYFNDIITCTRVWAVTSFKYIEPTSWFNDQYTTAHDPYLRQSTKYNTQGI